MAAADLDRSAFVKLATEIQPDKHLTLYVSRRDEDLLASRYLFNNESRGRGRSRGNCSAGNDTIDVSQVSRDALGHTY